MILSSRTGSYFANTCIMLLYNITYTNITYNIGGKASLSISLSFAMGMPPKTTPVFSSYGYDNYQLSSYDINVYK